MAIFSENTNFYSFEKGKLASSSGLIYPYFTKLNSPIPDSQYKDLLPAGFLKCQGQVLSADSYRSLANVIGVGNSCIYKREGVTLLDDDENGEGGQIQLPDLGSKYIVGSSVSGNYNNFETTDERVSRAGIATELDTLGDQVEFFYDGNFKIPGRDLLVQGRIVSESPPSRTDTTNLFMGNFLPHGHLADYNIADRVNTNSNLMPAAGTVVKTQCDFTCFCRQDGQEVCATKGVNYGLSFINVSAEETGNENSAAHFHFGTFPIITSESSTASLDVERVSAGPLITTVNIRSSDQIKMDSITCKFILCEYLIKY